LKRLIDQPFTVFVSHVSYREGFGGTEKYQLEDMQLCKAKGINVFQLYPRKVRKRRLHFIEYRVRLFGINYNDVSLSKDMPIKLLPRVLEMFHQSGALISYNIHHLLRWHPIDVSLLLRKIQGQRVLAYLHDVYFCCPSVHFLRDGKTYCGAMEEDFDPRSCATCFFGDQLSQVWQVYGEVFRQAHRIISPSPTVTTAFKKYYPTADSSKLIFVEHQKFTPSHARPPHNNEKLRVAYFGVRMPHKGWETFENLYSDETLAERYDFYHLGEGKPVANGRVKQVAYSFKADGFNAGINALLKCRIDMVLLFSNVPEAYSYTMHEAYAAGIPVLGGRTAGNVKYKIEAGTVYGRIFDDDEGLISFLKNETAVSRFLEENTNRFISTVEMQSAFLLLAKEMLPN